jgi:hypothetical protein
MNHFIQIEAGLQIEAPSGRGGSVQSRSRGSPLIYLIGRT